MKIKLPSRSGFKKNSIGLPLLVTLFLAILFSLTSRADEKNDFRLDAQRVEHLQSLKILKKAQPLSKIKLQDKVIVVAFFASWCPPCTAEFKTLNEIKKRLGDKAPVIVAVNVFEEFDDNDEARMQQFLKNTAPEFDVVEGTSESLKLFGDVFRIPTLYVFDQKGKMAFNFIHAPGAKKMSVDSSELMEAIKPLL